MIDLNALARPQHSFYFSMQFERSAGTFSNNTALHDYCEFLTSSANDVVFTPVTVNDALEVVSTSANDTSNGTNTRTVGVVYLDANGMWSQTIVTMNGTTPVPLTGITASAIICMSAYTGGTAQVSAGDINLRKVGTPTTIYEQIKAGGNQSQSGRITIPTGYYAILDDCHISVQGQPTETKVRLTRSKFDGATVDRYLFYATIKLVSGAAIFMPLQGIRLDQGQSLKISGAVDATTSNPRVHGSLDIQLIKY